MRRRSRLVRRSDTDCGHIVAIQPSASADANCHAAADGRASDLDGGAHGNADEHSPADRNADSSADRNVAADIKPGAYSHPSAA